jgi:hypothetical protein
VWFRPRGLPQKQTAAGKLKRQRGTLRPARELGVIEIATSRDPPLMPGWLTEAGKSAWHDNVGRVMQTGLGTEIDSDLLGFTVD